MKNLIGFYFTIDKVILKYFYTYKSIAIYINVQNLITLHIGNISL